MSDVAHTRRRSAEEYLAWQREQLDKHELHFGEIVAMANESPRHNFALFPWRRRLRRATSRAA